MSNQTNKIALVTGGSRGLGKNAAIALTKKGFDVIITYQSKKEDAENSLQQIKESGSRAAALQLDLANTNSFDAFVTTLQNELAKNFDGKKLDALVNNAGTGYYASIATTTEEGFDHMATTHLKAPFFITQKLLPLLNDGASIVNTSSGLARFSYEGYAAYAIMKAGIDALTRYEAQEFGKRKIRVNSIAPGAIETDFGGGAIRDNEALNQMIASQTALGRVGLPDDIGSVTAFLCSNESKWINAQRIEVSGGIYI